MAPFRVTKGFLEVMYFTNTSFSLRHCPLRTSVLTSIPAFLNSANPLPETRGLGSSIPETTFMIPDSIIILVQGGVLP